MAEDRPAAGARLADDRLVAALQRTQQRLAALASDAAQSPLRLIDLLTYHMQDGFSILSPEGVHLDVNPAFCTMTGYDREELIGVGLPHPYWLPEQRFAIMSDLRQFVGTGDGLSIDLTFVRKNGERFPVRLTPSIVRDEAGQPVCVFAIITDQSEQKQAQEDLAVSEARYRDVVESVPIGMIQVTPEGKVIYINPAAAAIFGYDTPQEMSAAVNGGSLAEILYVDPWRRSNYIRTLHAEPGKWHLFEDRFRRADGSLFEGNLYFSERVHAATNEPYLFGFIRDVSELKRTEAELNARNAELQVLILRLEEMATTDALTAIYNRRKFNQLIKTEIVRAQRYGEPLALFIFDIDHFKHINDTFGHKAGDKVLVAVANLMRSTSREVDIIARWGGEEFVVLAPSADVTTAATAAERFRDRIARRSFPSCGAVTASFGVAGYRAGDTPDQLFARADGALYKAKQNGRNRVVIAD
jgi:diguanylate cyclase (GGDEF)-like protein/PAS domain S-box-containing protein